jgi:hypothetical protein
MAPSARPRNCGLGIFVHHHSASRALIIAGLSEFLTLIQLRDGPDRYGTLSRFDTMPSRPILQACWKIVARSSSVCSLRTMPRRRFPRASLSVSCDRQRQGVKVLRIQHGPSDGAAPMQGVEPTTTPRRRG